MIEIMNDKQERIKILFQNLNHKSDFMNEIAEELERSPKTLRKWWFSSYGLWSVPAEFQDLVIERLEAQPENKDL